MTSFAIARLRELKDALLKYTDTTWEGGHINRELDAAIADIVADTRERWATHEKKRARK